MQIIVLDGPDAVGKTTLANKIIEMYPNTKYLHLTYRFKDKIFDYHTAAIRLASKWAKTHNVIIDRWWPTEACYATVYRGSSDWPLQGRFHDRLALKFGAVYVMCLPDHTTLKRFERMKQERDEMYESIDELCKVYSKLFHGDHSHKDGGNYIDQLIITGGLKNVPHYFPYTIEAWGHNMEYFIEGLMRNAERYREAQWPEALSPDEDNILGHRGLAKYMFVGEQVNPKYARSHWPFFDYGNCSLYLTEALHQMFIPEHEIAYTNVLDKNGNDDLRFVQKGFNEGLFIIAMGKKAQSKLKEYHMNPDCEINHPQWYKRFNGKGPGKLVEDLKGAVI